MYWKIYFDIFDQVLMLLQSRFKTDSSQFFKSLEAFGIGNTSDINKIIGFCHDDFDKDRLVSNRDMFLNLTSRTNKTVQNLKKAVKFLRENEYTMRIPPEYVKIHLTHARKNFVLEKLPNSSQTEDTLRKIYGICYYKGTNIFFILSPQGNIKYSKKTIYFAQCRKIYGVFLLYCIFP